MKQKLGFFIAVIIFIFVAISLRNAVVEGNSSTAAQTEQAYLANAFSPEQATQFIRETITSQSDSLVLTHHATERMAERGMTEQDILTILKEGQVKGPARVGSRGDFTYKMELADYTGPLPDPLDDTTGEKATKIKARTGGAVVIALPNPESENPRLVVVTVMWENGDKDGD